MSVSIDTPEELLAMLKKLNLQVANVDELRQLLATINANYNPEAARQKTGRLIGAVVPGVLAGAAALASVFLVRPDESLTSSHVAVLALVWGACTLVSGTAILAASIMTRIRHDNRRAITDSSARRSSRLEALETGITNLSI